MVVNSLCQARADPGYLLELSSVGAIEVGQRRRDYLSGPGAEAIAIAAKGEKAEEQGNNHAERKLPAAMDGGRGGRRLGLGGGCVHDGDRAAGSDRATI